MARASQPQLRVTRFILLFLAAASCLLPTTTAVDACTNSPDISTPLCARCDCNPNDAPRYTNCNDTSSYTRGNLLINNDAGQQDTGTKYLGLGRYITEAQCCATCQADSTCDAFNYINSGGGAGCYLLSNTNCNGHVYTKQFFGGGSYGTGGVPARVNMCPDECSASSAIYDPLCGTSRQVTSCTADDSSYTTGKLLMTGPGSLGYGTKYAVWGQTINRQQCCEACQADSRCNAFNYIDSGGGRGCYFLTSKECRAGTYDARTFGGGSYGTGGYGAQHNLCP